MKILVLSDIHGRTSSVDKIMDLFNNNNFDKVILLGDLLYHGPRNVVPQDYDVKYVYTKLNEIKDHILWIKGNCDSEVDEMVLDFKVHNDEYININGKDIYLVHGHHLNFDSTDEFKADCVLYGHYHIPSVKTFDGRKYINVGSISLPKQDSKRSYAVIEDGIITIFDIEDNILIKNDL